MNGVCSEVEEYWPTNNRCEKRNGVIAMDDASVRDRGKWEHMRRPGARTQRDQGL